MIEVGKRHKSRAVVSEEMTALSVGSGDMPVLATPIMIALMENAAMHAVAEDLDNNETTVGGYMECSHLYPIAVGTSIEAEAVLSKTDGKSLHFEITAFAEDKKIGEGHHIRYIVDRNRFLSKINK